MDDTEKKALLLNKITENFFIFSVLILNCKSPEEISAPTTEFFKTPTKNVDHIRTFIKSV